MIRLYSIPPSLYSAKVRLVLRYKGLGFEDIAPPGGYGSDEYKLIVPAGTLPAIDHDGFLLTESEAIIEYLEEIAPDPPLLPADPQKRAVARQLSRFHDTRLEPVVRSLFPQVVPASRGPDIIARQSALLKERLGQLERLTGLFPLLKGESFSLADCGFAITLPVLKLMDDAIGLGTPLPEIVERYHDIVQEQPCVVEEMLSYRPAISGWIGMQAGSGDAA